MQTKKSKINLLVSILLVVVLFTSAIVGTEFYYISVVNEKNTKISLLSDEITGLNNQISNLTNQVASIKANVTSPNLVSTLATKEYSWIEMGGGSPYNWVEVIGSVTNTGGGTAFNTGLLVVGYDDTGNLIVNVTVPLASGNSGYPAGFGSDKETDAYALYADGTSSLELENLTSGKTATIDLDIYHEGTINNWTATPVWTNTP